MAKKALLRDHDNIEILPITRGELILDSSGNPAFRSNEFLATDSQPGLMSPEDKQNLETVAGNTIDTELSTTSTNPVQNKVLTQIINSIKEEYLKSAVVSGNKITITDQNNNTVEFVNSTYQIVTNAVDGLVPKYDAVDGTIDTQTTDWVLTNHNGTLGWYKLPTTAFSSSSVQLFVGAKSTSNNNNSNSATINGNTYLKLFDNSTLKNQYNIKGTGLTTVISDDNGTITINVPTSHDQASSDISSLTGYSKATAVAAIATTDSLNTALGKLELKADTVYTLVAGAYDGDGTIENLTEILKVLEGISDTDTIQAIVGKYLPLSGGTMANNAGISWTYNIHSWDEPVDGLECISTYTETLGYYSGLSYKGYYGLQIRAYGGNTDNIQVRGSGRSTWGTWRNLIHSGNIGEQSVNYATSAGEADTLDGYHADIMVKSYIDSTDNFTSFTNRAFFKTAVIKDQGDFCSLVIPTWASNKTNSYYTTELRFNIESTNPKIRVTNPNGTSDWYTLARTVDNVASATKLSDDTAFTAWGQTFFENGKPKNVSGIAYFPNGDLIYAKDEGGTYRYVMGLTSGLSFGHGSASAGIDTYILGKNIHFRYYDTDYKYAMSIKNNGNVLIGTTDDNGEKLQVNGNVDINGHLRIPNNYSVYMKDTYGNELHQLWLTTNNTFFVGRGSVEYGYATVVCGNTIRFSTGGSAWNSSMVIDAYGNISASGNVLIGTTDDNGYKLSVNGSLNATTIYQNGTTLDTTYLKLSGGTIEGEFGALRIKRNNAYASAIRFENTSGVLGYIGFNDDYNARLWDKNQNDIGILIHSGNIGSHAPIIDNSKSADNHTKASIGYGLGKDSLSGGIVTAVFGNYGGQIHIPITASYPMRYRGRNNGSWNEWKTILDSSNYSSYALPLSGGTIDGTLRISNAGWGSQLSIINTNANEDMLVRFYTQDTNTNNFIGAIGFNANYEPIVNIAGVGTKALIHSGNYSSYALPLSGGTIEGDTNAPLAINGVGDWVGIGYFKEDSKLGYLGIWSDQRPVFIDATWNVHTLIHSGNTGNYVLFSRTPVTLDPSHNLNNYVSGYYGYSNAYNPSNSYGDNTAVLALQSVRGVDTWQLAFDGNGINSDYGPRIGIRGNFAEQGWTQWFTLATLNSNVASATKAAQDGDGNTISSTYLKKIGGTISGMLLIENAGWGSQLGIINTTANSDMLIRYYTQNTDNFIGAIGFNVNNEPIVNIRDAGNKLLIHSGNIGIQSVAGASFLNVYDTRTENLAPHNTYTQKLTFHFKDSGVIGLGTQTYYYSGMLQLSPWADISGGPDYRLAFNGPNIYHTYGNTDWGEWRQIAFTDSNVLHAQNLTNSNGTVGATVNSSGKVLIGTTTAANEKLQVYTTTTTEWGGVGAFMSESLINTHIQLGRDRSTKNSAFWGYHHIGTTSDNNYQGFGFWNTDYFLKIYANGDVGIGTTTDNGYKLQVNGNVDINGYIRLPNNMPVYMKDTHGNELYQLWFTTGNTFFVGRGSVEYGYETVVCGNTIRFSAGSSPWNSHAVIDAYGNVLIGTSESISNGRAKLQVKGHSEIDGTLYFTNASSRLLLFTTNGTYNADIMYSGNQLQIHNVSFLGTYGDTNSINFGYGGGQVSTTPTVWMSMSKGALELGKTGTTIGTTTYPRFGRFDRGEGALILQLGKTNAFEVIDKDWTKVCFGVGNTGIYVNGNAGIGTATPLTKLDVAGDNARITSYGTLFRDADKPNGYNPTYMSEIYQWQDSIFFTRNNPTTGAFLKSVAYINLGNGNITTIGRVSAPDGFYQESDERLKTFYDPIKVDLEKLSKLRKNYFKFNDKDKLEIGVSAQEIQEIYPEIVSTNDEGYLSVAYDKLSVIALSAIDELHEENKKLKERVDELEKLLTNRGIL